MKKYQTVLSMSIVLSLFLILFGCKLMGDGIVSKIRISNCKALKMLEVNELHGGEYVCGNIGLLLGKESNFSDRKKLFPLCNTDVFSREETYVMQIRDVEKYYICVKVDPKFLSAFKNTIETDLSSSYLLYGKIKKMSGYDLSIRNSLNENKADSNQTIDNKYLIEIVDFDKEIEKIYQGFFVLLSGGLLFLGNLKIEKVTS